MLDRSLLQHMLAGRAVIMCVGNEWRGDEGVGHHIAGILRPSERLSVVDCGETPENYLGVITDFKPEAVIVISAVGFGADPGDVRVLKRREVGEFTLSTLVPRLLIFTDYIEAKTGAATLFVGIQPATLEFGSPLGPAVAEAGRNLARAINEVISGPRRPRRSRWRRIARRAWGSNRRATDAEAPKPTLKADHARPLW
jgi:hydrogenase 3 maturation protease